MTTLLSVECKHWRTDIVELLLRHGTNINGVDEPQQTVLHIACCQNNIDTVERLLQYGADVNARDNDNKTPYDVAQSNDVRQLLIQHGYIVPSKCEC